MTEPILPPLKPIPIKDRISVVYVEKGNLDVLDGAFVVVDKTGVRTHLPVGGVACLMLEPGTRVSHAAVTLASRVGCLLVWIGEAGVRLYASGQPGGARADRLLYQAKLALDDAARLRVVRKMYALRFREEPPERRSVQQLRGIEGVRVRKMYELLARQYGVDWKHRNYDHTEWAAAMFPTAVSVPQPPVFTVSARRLYLRRGMPRRSVSSIQASRSPLCTILPISSSLKPLCRLPSA